MKLPVYSQPVTITPDIAVGNDIPLLIAGPCVIESEQLCLDIAGTMKDVAAKTGFHYVFKASFDKANRTAAHSYRGEGMAFGLEVLQKVKEAVGVPVLSDIHLPAQAEMVAAVADVLQIPAFLCRQTDLLLAAGATGRAVNIKKGQFMAPEDMQYAADKVRTAGNQNVLLTERGFSFGYRDLVVDMRSLPVMRRFAPVIFDVTHSVQMPGGAGGASGGRREFAPYLARAAAAAGVDGFFIETHPQPDQALSDGPNMIPLADMEALLVQLKRIMEVSGK